mmetsp:Transcript_15575/g.31508  ORF Transcript_15575/g.31508 Transcript_15575/m.31508 type:complete len:96 (+) Transcript_15575:1341-1628(+)
MCSLLAINVMPNNYPEVDEHSNVDPNTLSLTRAELGQRSSYDASNAIASLRRSSIIRASQLGAVGSSIMKGKIEEVPENEEEEQEQAPEAVEKAL